MKLHLLRHGQTNWNLEGRLQGQKNVPLNQTGKQQIERFCKQAFVHEHRGSTVTVSSKATAPTMPYCPYTIVLTSSLQRTLQSAQLCSQWFGLPLAVEPAFAERSFGVLEGMMKDEIRRQFHIEDIEALDDVHGIEPMTNFRSRLEAGLRRLPRTYRDERILLVTHGSVIRLLMTMTSSIYAVPSSMAVSLVQSGRIVPNGHVVEMDLP